MASGVVSLDRPFIRRDDRGCGAGRGYLHRDLLGQVAAFGEDGGELGGVYRPGGGVIVGLGPGAEPQDAEAFSHGCADHSSFGRWEAHVQVSGQLGASLIAWHVRELQAGDGPGDEDGFGCVPVGVMAGVAGFGAGAENLARVIGGDLVLVAVGSDHPGVVEPFLVLGMIAG